MKALSVNAIQKYKNIAIEEMDRTGIPASIKLAQGILESGCGTSQLAINANNHFGIKCHNWNGPSFTMDDDRLKQGGSRYFRELLQRIRDIRSSERNFYQQVTDIYATAIDYDPRSDMTKKFFATVQNKLHFAVHEHTAAEVIYERVDSEKPLVGMTNFKGSYITKDDVKIAKNYLTETELKRLNLLVSQFLDFAEFQAMVKGL